MEQKDGNVGGGGKEQGWTEHAGLKPRHAEQLLHCPGMPSNSSIDQELQANGQN